MSLTIPTSGHLCEFVFGCSLTFPPLSFETVGQWVYMYNCSIQVFHLPLMVAIFLEQETCNVHGPKGREISIVQNCVGGGKNKC